MNKNKFNYFFTISFFSLLTILFLTDNSFAATYTVIESTLCKLLDMLTGTIGKGVAAFAIMFVGISLFMGKVSWGLAISTALGIGAIFGAAGIVTALGGGDLNIGECADYKESDSTADDTTGDTPTGS